MAILRWKERLLAGAAVVAALCAGGDARANGRFPAAQHVVIGPGATSRIIALRTTFGMLLSTDGGATFQWMCEEAMFYPFVPSLYFDAPTEIASRGAVVFGYEDGIRYATTGCKTDDVRGTAGHVFADLTSDPTGRTIYGIEAGQGVSNAVYRGDGESMAFTRLGAGLTSVLFDTIEVAPSNLMRLYLTGRDNASFAPVLYRSDDGGATLTPVPLTGAPADSLWVSGVDPRDPDVLFVRAAMGLGTELRKSTDGGRTFHRVASTTDPMLGFALSGDGRTAWVGSIGGGLQRSDDGGETFNPVNPMPVLCLREHEGVLWACSDWINQPFALGRSGDRGATFEPVVRFDDFTRFVGPPMCADRSEGAAICVERWEGFMSQLGAPADPDAGTPPPPDAGPRDAARDVASDARADRPDASTPADAPMDAAADVAAEASIQMPRPPDGCSCAAPGAPASARGLLATGLALALAAARRRRRAR